MIIILKAVVLQTLGQSSGPEILTFIKLLTTPWPNIIQKKFSTISDAHALRYTANSTLLFTGKQFNISGRFA